MRIVLINQFFWPDSAATSQLLADLSRELITREHEVHVICATPGYASDDAGRAPAGVIIHHVRATSFSRKTLGRLTSYASFYLGAARRLLSMRRPDVVLTLTTPPLLSVIGNAAKLLRGSRHCIWEMDLYPDVAIDLGHFPKGGVFDRVVGGVVDVSRRFADGIVALGSCMKTRLTARGTAAHKITIIHNWADSTAIQPTQLEPAKGFVRILYSGNLGLAHDVDTLFNSMLTLRDDSRLRFRFVGGGGQRQRLMERAASAGLRHAEFAPYANRELLGENLSRCDIGLVTQRDACCGSVVPSKVYGLLAAARPILFIGPGAATPAQIIRDFACGWQIDCGDDQRLSALLLHLAAHPEEIAAAGVRARAALEAHFDLHLGVARIADLLTTHQQPARYPSERPQTLHPLSRKAS